MQYTVIKRDDFGTLSQQVIYHKNQSEEVGKATYEKYAAQLGQN